jgi:ATP-dependent Clp protease ATP-binding subunit ClpC
MLKHNYVGTEHILLGLLRLEDGRATELLDPIGVTLEDVRARVRETVGEGAEVVSGQIPFTPRAKKVLEHSLREALARGDNYIGPEHVLFGLLRTSGAGDEPEEWDEELLREGVQILLSGPGDRPECGTRAYGSGRIAKRSRRAAPRFRVAAPVLGIAAIALLGIGVFVGWLIWGH